MLVSITREFVNIWLITVLKTKQHVLAISKKAVLGSPRFCTKSTEDPAEFVLYNEYSIFVLTAIRIECDETAPIFIHFVNSFPVTPPVKAWQTPNQIWNLQIVQQLAIVGLLRSVFQNLLFLWNSYTTFHFVYYFIYIFLSFFVTLNYIVIHFITNRTIIAIIALRRLNLIDGFGPLEKIVLSQQTHSIPLHRYYTESTFCVFIQVHRIIVWNKCPWFIWQTIVNFR